MSTGKAPALYHMRTLARTSKVLDVDSSPACPSPPPFRSHVSVPFLWEDVPGQPKLRAARPSALSLPSASPAPALADAGATAGVAAASGHEDGDGAHARPLLLKLKLPPRLQAAEHPLSSPKTVLHGPYFGGAGRGNKPPRPLRRIMSTASCRRAGGGLFVWRKGAATATTSAGSKGGGHCQLYAVAPDASCCSPAASSSSSSSMSYFFDDHSRRQADGRDDSEDGEGGDDGAKGTVRITRFRRNRSLPTMSRSHLWANIRKGVKQITPWSYKPT